MYVPEALGCMATVALRSDRLSEVEGATDPEAAEKEGCTHTAAKDLDENY